ncbi:MAG: FG-GAP-like repeat-containing protein [Calditrichia bacterium]
MIRSLLLFIFILSAPGLAQTAEIKWWFDLNDAAYGSAALDDIDNDGKPEIVFSTYFNDGKVYALNAEDGSLLWEYVIGGCNDVAPLIHDVNGDGFKDVILPSSCILKTFCFDGRNGSVLWSTETAGSDSSPTIADIDQDGEMEILHGTFDGSVICLDAATGDIEWDLIIDPNGVVQSAPTVLDADMDGQLDFVVANWSFGNSNKYLCYRGVDQQLLWENSIPTENTYHGASVADLDKDGTMELAFGCYDGSLYVLEAESGNLHWSYKLPNSVYIPGPTSIADLDNDGEYEITYMDFNNLAVVSHTGVLQWSYSLPEIGQSFRASAISDVNNDGTLDLVLGSDNGRLYAFNGSSATELWSVNLREHYGASNFMLDHGPVIADFDGDDILDVFIAGGYGVTPPTTANYGRVYAISTGSIGGPEWPMFRKDKVRSGRVDIAPPTGLESRTTTALAPQSIKSYPNPATSIITIAIKNQINENFSLTVYDILGRSVRSFSGSQFQSVDITTDNLVRGVYFYKLIAGKNVEIAKGKFLLD